MTTTDRSMKSEDIPQSAGMSSAGLDEANQQIERIRRIGSRMFGVHACIVILQNDFQARAQPKEAPISVEASFCHSLAAPANLVVVSDTHIDETLREHRLVSGAPRIRFYAAQPIYNSELAVIGSINLIDYLPRIFGDDDQRLLIDLAALVQRELHLQSISALQLDLQKKNKNLRRKSLIDPMIGTWNRGAIMRILTIEALRCDKAGIPLSLVVVDLDHFKKINDTCGHPAGDAVLVKVASKLRSCIRPQEALGRYGGEEFLIVLPGASHSTAMAVAERMRLAVANEPEVIGDATLSLTISAGVSSTDFFPSATTDELISRADMALYAAKNAGRNRTMQATPDPS
jgi:diguanylate cyclase (GGDEF)-like protein